MDPLDGPETFYSLPPELRNTVYRLHFDATTTAIDHNDVKPKRKGRVRAIRYTPADSLHEAVSIFLASHLVYNETRGLFLLEYCRGARFSLRSRHSIYAFSRLTAPLFQGVHRIDLSASLEVEGRRALNPIKLALRVALLTAGDQDTLTIHRSELHHSGQSLNLTATLKIADSEFQLVIKRSRAGKINFQLTGPITKLDWSFIPMMQSMTVRDELDDFMDEAEAELRDLLIKPTDT